MASYSGDLSEEEQAARAREERQQIVLRYDQGREDGAVIDDWEDPKFEIYHTQDRFGFIHDQRLPATTRSTDEEKKAFDREMNRVDKWLKMLKEQPKWFPRGSKNHEKMVERVWKGVPERMRGSLWRILLDLDQIKAEQEGKYQEMRELARRHSPDIRQIDLDVNRTYRNHIMFRERYNTRQQDLFHVLGAYSIYNSEVGYCQGMSQIAALLLMYLNDDEDAFWALSQLMVGRRWNMHGFFIPGFPKLIRFQEHHDKILMKKLRRLQKHLIANGVDTGIYTLKWFFQCFLDRMPYSLTIRVWDLYLLEGETIMFAMAYTILKLHRKALLKMGMDELLEFLQKTMETDFGFDDDYVIETALKESLAELRSSRLHTAGPPPDNEKPQKPFGLHSFPTPEEEASKARRNPTTQGDRLFSEETARRGEEQSRRLAALNTSQASMDDGSLGSADDTDEIISPPPPKSRTTPSLPPSPMPPNREQDDLDDSLQFMMRQAALGEAKQEEKKDQRRRVNEAPRPASAEPGRLVEDRKGGGGGNHQGGDRRSFGNSKRLSHHGHLSERSQSHSKSSFSASYSSMNQVLDTSRTSRTSSELTSGSSRLNTSQESNHRVNTSFEASSHHVSGTRESSARSPHTQRSGRQGSSAREGRATPESRQRISSRGAEDGRTTPSSSRQKRPESGRETPETARQRRLQEESRRVVEARRAQEESRRAQEEQVSQRRSQEQSQRRSQEQSHRRKEEMQGATKKSSYYFGEEPELSTNGGIDLQDDEEDSLTPTEEREGVREHAGEVVRIRVPYTEQDLTQQYNIQRLNAQKISPRFNGHKVTIQVNHGDGAPRLDDSFSSEPPLSPASRRGGDSSRHQVPQEKVGSSNCVHTTTHAMFVDEPRAGNGEANRGGRRAPLAQQEFEEPLSSNGHPVVRQPGRHPSHRHSLNESFSSSSEGEPRAQRHSTSGELRQIDQRVDELRRETFF